MQKQTQSPDQDISRSLKNFLRGLTQNDIPDMYESYKALFQAGPAAIPQIRDLIFKSNWSKVKYPNEIRYVAGLVSLVHDLNEFESEQIRSKLLNNGCAPALGRILDSIGSFKSANYIHYEVRGVKIFEHKKLVTRQNVKRRLEQWLKVIPDNDLAAIERIYIIRREDLTALGSYAPILFCINLAWDNPAAGWNPTGPFCVFILTNSDSLAHASPNASRAHWITDLISQSQPLTLTDKPSIIAQMTTNAGTTTLLDLSFLSFSIKEARFEIRLSS